MVTAPSTSAPLSSICPTSHLPGRESARSRAGAAAHIIHPQSSVWRALQPRYSSQPSPASSGAPGEGRVFQNLNSGWGHEKGFLCAVSPWLRSITWGSRKAQGAGWDGFGLVGTKSTAPMCWDSHCCVSHHSHTEQEQKQRRALAPSLPLAEPSAQPDSSPGSLAPLPPCAAARTLPDTLCSPWMLRGCLSNTWALGKGSRAGV